MDSDNVRLEMAINESSKQTENTNAPSLVDLSAAARTLKDPWEGETSDPKSSKSNDPFNMFQEPSKPQVTDPWATTTTRESVDPWAAPSNSNLGDAWSSSSPSMAQPINNSNAHDPFSSQVQTSSNFDAFANQSQISSSIDPFDSLSISRDKPTQNQQQPFDFTSGIPPPMVAEPTTKAKRSAADFLGGSSDLVNLDSLVTRPANQPVAANPFLANTATNMNQQPSNPMTMNQMKGFGPTQQPVMGSTIMASMNMGMGVNQPTMTPYGAYPIPQQPMVTPMNMGQPPMMGNMGQMNIQPVTTNQMGMPQNNNPFL